MDIPRNWRLGNQRYQLEGSSCDRCNSIFYPPREICPACHSRTLMPLRLRGEGRIASYTILHQAPVGFEEQVPYAVGLIDLDEGPRLTAMLTDTQLEELSIGLPVEVVIRKINEDGEHGIINYGYKFRPKW